MIFTRYGCIPKACDERGWKYNRILLTCCGDTALRIIEALWAKLESLLSSIRSLNNCKNSEDMKCKPISSRVFF